MIFLNHFFHHEQFKLIYLSYFHIPHFTTDIVIKQQSEKNVKGWKKRMKIGCQSLMRSRSKKISSEMEVAASYKLLAMLPLLTLG